MFSQVGLLLCVFVMLAFRWYKQAREKNKAEKARQVALFNQTFDNVDTAEKEKEVR